MTLERPMFPPVDPTRRHFLSVAAGGAVAAAVNTATARATPTATRFLRLGSLELDLTNRHADGPARARRPLALLGEEFETITSGAGALKAEGSSPFGPLPFQILQPGRLAHPGRPGGTKQGKP
jgi:hypothetical protein